MIADGLTVRASVRFPCATALLAYWQRTWSSNARRYATHALTTAYRAGCDVLEAGRDGGRDRMPYTHAMALIAYWERPSSERAYRAAREALAVIGALMGEDAEDLS